MIWLTWRQFRAQAAVIFAALGALAVTLALTGPNLAHLAQTAGRGFLDQVGADPADITLYYLGLAAVIAAPAVIGAFWGAPLIARELDAGTHRLVWNQSITRTRWLATKLALTGAAAVAAAGLLSLAVTWWCGPIDTALDAGGHLAPPRISPLVFPGRGIAPIGYTAFAFALGVAAGVLVRRTVPALALTLAVYTAVQIAMPFWIRPHLVAPARTSLAITPANLNGFVGSGPDGPMRSLQVTFDNPGAWTLSDQTVDGAGHAVSPVPTWVGGCLTGPGHPAGSSQPECFAQLSRSGYHQQITYQPPSHFWALQWTETALFVTLAALLTAVTFWLVRTPRSSR